MATTTSDGGGLTSAEPLAVVFGVISALLFGAGGLAVGFALALIATLALFAIIGSEPSPAVSLVVGLVFVQGVGCIGVALSYPKIREYIGRPIATALGIGASDDPASEQDMANDSFDERATAADEGSPADDDEVVSGPASPVETDGPAAEQYDELSPDGDTGLLRFGAGKRQIWPGDGFSIPYSVPSLKDIAVILGGFVLAFGGVLLVATIVTVLLDPDTGTNQAAEIGMENPNVLLLLIPASILLIGPGEELLFRGVVQGRLREVFHPYAAIVIAAAFFAALHFVALVGGSTTGNIIALGILTVPSIVFGAVYEYTENIVVPSMVHGIYNAFLFTILYVSVVFADEFEAGATMLASLV